MGYYYYPPTQKKGSKIVTGILIGLVIGSLLTAFIMYSIYEQSSEDIFSEKQAKELLYYRLFELYDYTSDQYYYAWYRIRALDYLKYRLNSSKHTPSLVGDRLTKEYILESVNSWKDPESSVVREIALDLLQISKGDTELFVNLAMQLVHQIYYNITLYTKYPVETLVEGSGDCDNLATLLAAILRAGGLDVVVLLVIADGSGHAMVGVALPRAPKHITYFGKKYYTYYTYNGKKYYLCEATWMRLEVNRAYIHPASLQALRLIGSMVGDNPWKNLVVKQVVHVP